MIPTFTKLQSYKLNIENKSYFNLTTEYLELQKIFLSENIFDYLILIFDLILYPIWIIFTGMSYMDIFTLMKCFQLWKDLLRFQELHTEIWYWKFMVQLVGGPWISTNDSDYHLYVYADAMTRFIEVSQKTD
jgi:hypothetical protein